MHISGEDFRLLKSGQVPSDDELMCRMFIGQRDWIDEFKDYYLYNFVGKGYGSKVKFLIGSEGCGKTHALRLLGKYAKDMGYEVCHLSIKDLDIKISDMASLYKEICNQVNKERIVAGLCKRVASDIGYNDYDGDVLFLPIMLEYEKGIPASDAKKEIRRSLGSIIKKLDVLPSFVTFCFQACHARMVDDNNEVIDILLKWLSGISLTRQEKNQVGIFDKLQRHNARLWLNCLIKLLDFVGIKGLFVAIDDLESVLYKNDASKTLNYTRGNLNDLFEMIRQFIDETEHISNFIIFFAGRNELLDDEKRGFKSYEALQMRIQTGIIQKELFNPYADIIDFDQWLCNKDESFFKEINYNLRSIFEESGYRFDFKMSNFFESESKNIRSAIIETSNFMEGGEDDD
ncbi:BREX system ATP-binding domain-containing protein [Thermodesulfobium sp. 4217-1]|uniref:BREX system ATP-binding domain-containing protein n=1 Tax=Thermodesulfobium sp. 4217-1 TaxID=3120013 RepID=UPI0032222183